MVLDDTGSVYNETVWYLVSIIWYCLLLGGTGSGKGLNASIYWKKWRFGQVTPMPHISQTTEYRAYQLVYSIKFKLSHAIKSTEKLHKKNDNIQLLFRADNNQCSPSDICTAPHVMQGWDGIDLLVRFSNPLTSRSFIEGWETWLPSALSEVFYLPHSLFTDQVGNLFTCFWLWACLCLKGHEGRRLMRPMIIDNPSI